MGCSIAKKIRKINRRFISCTRPGFVLLSPAKRLRHKTEVVIFNFCSCTGCFKLFGLWVHTDLFRFLFAGSIGDCCSCFLFFPFFFWECINQRVGGRGGLIWIISPPTQLQNSDRATEMGGYDLLYYGCCVCLAGQMVIQ